MKVVNVRFYNGPGIYVGRPTKWGNPFYVGRHGYEEDRQRVIRQFEEYARDRLAREPDWLDDLRDTPALMCYCAPKACHADVLKRMIEQKFDKT